MAKLYCLMPELVSKLKKAILNGEITPDKLKSLNSSNRRALLSKYLDDTNAKEVNLLIENKMLLKNQEEGLVKAFRELLGDSAYLKQKEDIAKKIKERVQARKDLIFSGDSEGLYDEVASDIFSRKYNTDISLEETSNIIKMSKEADKLKEAIPVGSPDGSKERLAYGLQDLLTKKYIAELKKSGEQMSIKEWIKPKNYGKALYNALGTTKSLMASFDNSFFGTQGLKVLAIKPDIWTKDFLKSFKDIGRQLVAKGEEGSKLGIFGSGDDSALNIIKADVFSRENALNGKYKNLGIDIGLDAEEAFPTAIPEYIPVLGRLYKSSEVAFNGGALRMRADLADRYIKWAEKQGIDLNNKEQAEGIGRIINSMTGRGSLGKAEVLSKEINATLFSAKFLKSNIDTLTAHVFDKKVSGPAQRLAAQNLLKIITSIGGTAVLAKQLGFEVEIDPRGGDFIQVKTKDGRKFDISGKMGSLTTLISRVIPTVHNGEWGLWSKSSKTGIFTKLNEPEFAKQNALDVFDSFWQGKLSPTAGMLRDYWKGTNMKGEKFDAKKSALGLVTPLPYSTAQDLIKNDADVLLNSIISGIGFNVGFSKNQEDWNDKESEEFTQFKSKIGEGEFEKANKTYNNIIDQKINKLTEQDSYKNLSDEDKKAKVDEIKSDAKESIFKSYNFKKVTLPTKTKSKKKTLPSKPKNKI